MIFFNQRTVGGPFSWQRWLIASALAVSLFASFALNYLLIISRPRLFSIPPQSYYYSTPPPSPNSSSEIIPIGLKFDQSIDGYPSFFNAILHIFSTIFENLNLHHRIQLRSRPVKNLRLILWAIRKEYAFTAISAETLHAFLKENFKPKNEEMEDMEKFLARFIKNLPGTDSYLWHQVFSSSTLLISTKCPNANNIKYSYSNHTLFPLLINIGNIDRSLQEYITAHQSEGCEICNTNDHNSTSSWQFIQLGSVLAFKISSLITNPSFFSPSLQLNSKTFQLRGIIFNSSSSPGDYATYLSYPRSVRGFFAGSSDGLVTEVTLADLDLIKYSPNWCFYALS